MTNKITINKLYDYLQYISNSQNVDPVELDEYNLNILYVQKLISYNDDDKIRITTLGEVSLLGGQDSFVSFFQQIYLQLNLDAALNHRISELERHIKKIS